jgi:hypothetical protein
MPPTAPSLGVAEGETAAAGGDGAAAAHTHPTLFAMITTELSVNPIAVQ